MYTKIWSKQLLSVSPYAYVYASDEAIAAQLDVGDSLKVNDGMGINDYEFIGYPADTTETGDFTLTVRIEKVEEDNGAVLYRASVKWEKSKAKFLLPDEVSDAELSYFGDGKRVNVSVVASQDSSTIETNAGLTESNSLYRGNYALIPKVEPLPDCSYRMEICGESISSADLPRVIPSPSNSVFSLVQIKDNKLRYKNICSANKVKEELARTLSIDITPSDADITYTLSAEGNTFTQNGGTVHGYNGETVAYRIVKAGYQTIEGTYVFDLVTVNKILDITMEEFELYRNVYPNGTFSVGDIVLLNDGIGENSQRWTANPTSDTSYAGPFTLDGEIKEIDPNTGYLAIEADILEYKTVNITSDQEGSAISAFGDNDNATVSIVADQNDSNIVSSAGIETVASLIRGYESCQFDSLTDYTIRLESNNTVHSTGGQFLVKTGDVVSCALMYNNRLVMYEQIIAKKQLIKKRQTVTIVPDVAGATVKIYGNTTNSIQAYSGQVIEYEVSAEDYLTATGTYTVPTYDISSMSYVVSVHLYSDPSENYTFDSDGNLVDCNTAVYLNATGTQYIDTGIAVSDSNTIETRFRLVTGSEPTICGTYATGTTSRYSTNSVTYISSSSYSRVLKTNGMRNISMTTGVHTLRYSSSNVLYDDTTLSWESDGNNTYIGNLCLFTSRYGSSQNYGKLGINRHKIYDSSNTLVRDMVPVPQGLVIKNYTVPSNGMWDIVNQQFYPNVGSGDFVFEVI